MGRWIVHMRALLRAHSPRMGAALDRASHGARRLESAVRRRLPDAWGGAYPQGHVRTRVLGPEDAAALRTLREQQTGKPLPRGGSAPTRGDHGFVLGAFVQGALCGYANCLRVELPGAARAVLVAPIYVDAGQRRRQLGRHLLRASLEEARGDGATQAFAWIHGGNLASQATFGALHFRPRPPHEEGYLHGPGHRRPTPHHELWGRPLDDG